ncbi:hypothetical protein [Pseudactinotalea sp.]|uniref:hypothetical protein n=1 Tax=Pseudactinotalea sp. TaxID=1926260 RepID=UPI003B3A1071
MRTARPLALAAVLGASLVLAGCSGGSENTSDGGGGTSPEETTQEAPEFDVEAIDLGEPGETEPGTTLALGEPAWVTTQVTPSDSDTAEDVQMGLTLLDITEGSTDIWAGWETEDEFEGYTPYLMVLQYSYPDGLPEGVESPPAPAIFPLLEDGSGASFIEAQNFGMGAGASDVCGYTLQGWDPETNTNVVCAVGLSDAGPITGGLFNGDNWSGILQGWDETYGNSPIIWE